MQASLLLRSLDGAEAENTSTQQLHGADYSPFKVGATAHGAGGGYGPIGEDAVSPAGGGAEGWRAAFGDLMAQVRDFAPDLILVSAGFDAHRDDPLGGGPDGQQLTEADYAWATRQIVAAAEASARGRVVSALEGGYDLQALGRSAAAHVRALQEG